MPHAGGRPTSYRIEYNNLVDDYLKTRQDEVRQIVKFDGDKGTSYEEKIVVKMPTLEGLAEYIGVDKGILYDWEKKYPEFHHSLRKVRTEQHDRLLNNGLAGSYNSTLAKLGLCSNHGYKDSSSHEVTGKDGSPLMPEPLLGGKSNGISNNTIDK